jgi:hypothetical protein
LCSNCSWTNCFKACTFSLLRGQWGVQMGESVFH